MKKLIYSILLLSSFLGAMEKESPKLNLQLPDIATFPEDQKYPKQEDWKNELLEIRFLNMAANILNFHAHVSNDLLLLAELVPQIKECEQDFNVTIDGKKCKYFYMFTDMPGAIEIQENVYKKDSDSLHYKKIITPGAIVTYLRFHDLFSLKKYYDSVLKNESPTKCFMNLKKNIPTINNAELKNVSNNSLGLSKFFLYRDTILRYEFFNTLDHKKDNLPVLSTILIGDKLVPIDYLKKLLDIPVINKSFQLYRLLKSYYAGRDIDVDEKIEKITQTIKQTIKPLLVSYHAELTEFYKQIQSTLKEKIKKFKRKKEFLGLEGCYRYCIPIDKIPSDQRKDNKNQAYCTINLPEEIEYQFDQSDLFKVEENKKSPKFSNKKRIKQKTEIPTGKQEEQKIENTDSEQVIYPISFDRTQLLETGNYADRVKKYFKPTAANKFTYKEIFYHTFTPLIDQCAIDYGIHQKRKNETTGQKDDLYQISGEIQRKGMPSKIVVFQCTKDPQGVIYHRGFEIKEKNNLFDEYFKKGHWEFNKGFNDSTYTEYMMQSQEHFPALGSELKKNDISFDEIVYEDDLIIEIKDNAHDIRIVLHKLKDDN